MKRGEPGAVQRERRRARHGAHLLRLTLEQHEALRVLAPASLDDAPATSLIRSTSARLSCGAVQRHHWPASPARSPSAQRGGRRGRRRPRGWCTARMTSTSVKPRPSGRLARLRPLRRPGARADPPDREPWRTRTGDPVPTGPPRSARASRMSAVRAGPEGAPDRASPGGTGHPVPSVDPSARGPGSRSATWRSRGARPPACGRRRPGRRSPPPKSWRTATTVVARTTSATGSISVNPLYLLRGRRPRPSWEIREPGPRRPPARSRRGPRRPGGDRPGRRHHPPGVRTRPREENVRAAPPPAAASRRKRSGTQRGAGLRRFIPPDAAP